MVDVLFSMVDLLNGRPIVFNGRPIESILSILIDAQSSGGVSVKYIAKYYNHCKKKLGVSGFSCSGVNYGGIM